jgi:hypothetical protein
MPTFLITNEQKSSVWVDNKFQPLGLENFAHTRGNLIYLFIKYK